MTCKKFLSALAIVSAILLAAPLAALAGNSTDNLLKVDQGGKQKTYDLDKLKTEIEDGKVKTCVCKMICFRALQAAAKGMPGKVAQTDNLMVYSRWATDGPEEFFVETLGWPVERVKESSKANPPQKLVLDDAQFLFVDPKSGKAWLVKAGPKVFPADFFQARTKYKAGGQSKDQSDQWHKRIRPKAVKNLEQQASDAWSVKELSAAEAKNYM